MSRPRTWTDGQLAEAVKGAPSWAEVSRRLGMNPYGKTTVRLRRHAARMGLDVSHLPARTEVQPIESPGGRDPLDPDAVRSALATSRSWAESLGKLGMVVSGSNYDKIKRVARELDADVSSLFGQAWARAPITPLAIPFTNAPKVEQIRKAGAAIATAWFLERGYMVSLPVEPVAYDLIVESDEGFQRVQVKTGGPQKVKISKTEYGRGTSPSMGKYGRRLYRADEIDLFFIYTTSRDVYLVPIAAVEGVRDLYLAKYAPYRRAS